MSKNMKSKMAYLFQPGQHSDGMFCMPPGLDRWVAQSRNDDASVAWSSGRCDSLGPSSHSSYTAASATTERPCIVPRIAARVTSERSTLKDPFFTNGQATSQSAGMIVSIGTFRTRTLLEWYSEDWEFRLRKGAKTRWEWEKYVDLGRFVRRSWTGRSSGG